jgi:transcriptional regulator with XRE-family HTH domain
MGNKMPARSPPLSTAVQDSLLRLGAGLQQARKRQKVSAMAAAEAAGMSRVTLHRIERGEPSVAMGAWAAAAQALGLVLEVADPAAAAAPAALPARIRLQDFPQLQALAWQLQGVDELSPQEALDLYERNWRHVNGLGLSLREIELIRTLSATLGGGRLLV